MSDLAVLVIRQHPVLVPQCPRDLGRQLIMQHIDQAADVIPNVALMQTDFASETRVEHILEVQHDLRHPGVARQRAVTEVIDRIIWRVGFNDRFGQDREAVLSDESQRPRDCSASRCGA